MKLTVSCIGFIVLFISLFTSDIAAREGLDLGFWGGYSRTEGEYIDRLEEEIPGDINRHQYAGGVDLWAGGLLQFGFMMGINSLYSFNEKMKAVKTGDKWTQGGTVSHSFELRSISFPLMFTARIMLTENLYIGAGTGYQLMLAKPTIDGKSYNRYGDDGVVSMAIAGYNINLTGDTYMGVSFRTIWGYEQKNMFVSYIPAIAFIQRLH